MMVTGSRSVCRWRVKELDVGVDQAGIVSRKIMKGFPVP